jgi:hypothetical protein
MRSRLLITLALLNLVSLVHCMRVSNGIEIDVAYQPEATPAQIRTDMGYRVALKRALLVLGKVELMRCDNPVADRVDIGELLGPARARAHVLDTPTSLGVPLILDLMESAGTPQFAGTMKPPPGRYCGIRVLGMPADSDAVGLSDENLDMMQNSVLVAGQVRDETSGDEMPLMALIWEVLQCEMLFDRPLVFHGPVLESLSIQIDHTSWFDRIDFALESPDAVRRKITENVRLSLKAVLPDKELGL